MQICYCKCAYFRSVAFSKLFKVFAWKYSLLRKSRAVDHFSTGREKKNRKFLFSFQCLVTFLFDENDLQNIFFKGWCYADDHFWRAAEKSSADHHHNFGKRFVWFFWKITHLETNSWQPYVILFSATKAFALFVFFYICCCLWKKKRKEIFIFEKRS